MSRKNLADYGKGWALKYLTKGTAVVILANMTAKLLLNERHIISKDAFVEIVVWRLPSPIPGSLHGFKYRLALVVKGVCVLRYDNELGKGDHKHIGEKGRPYIFTTPQKLLDDFWNDVDYWRI